jgi:homocitrate synthase
MVVSAPDYVKQRYELKNLKPLENNVAEQVNLKTPFNNPITGWCAFTHKAGIHAKAILKSPGTYEVLNPEDWGVDRTVVFASRLTGWNAIKSRVEQLGLNMTDDQVKELTAKIKQTADTRPLGVSDTDEIIREFHQKLQKE